MFDRLVELFHLRRKKKCPDWSGGQLCRRFSLADVKLITNHFNESYIIGRGGFGTVFKGRLANGAPVAVKRWLSTSRQGVAEFWNEIEMLSQLRHRHIVNLIGYCDEKGEMILVYDYAPRGSLAENLYERTDINYRVLPTPLTWLERLQICIGAAHGLNYLHSGTSLQCNVIHRDLKSSNILLDDNLTAKISDFGLAKLGPGSEYRSYSMVPVDRSWSNATTAVVGTLGYLDPAYVKTKEVSLISDVYAFGVVLFEVLCGRPALLNSSFDQERQNLARWAVSCMKEGRLDWIVDPNLDGQILPECLRVFAQIARQCVHARPEKRPTMAEVLVRLKFAFALQQMGYTSLGEGALIFTSGAHEEQEDSDSEAIFTHRTSSSHETGRHDERTDDMNDTTGAYNSRENADSVTENEVISPGNRENEVISPGNSMDYCELINWISDIGGAHIKQDDAASSMEQEVKDAGSSMDYRELINWISDIGGTHNKQDDAASSIKHEGEQINGSISTGGAGDVGHYSEQMAESSDNGGASDRTRSSQETGQYDSNYLICSGHHDEQTDHMSDIVDAYKSHENTDSLTENEVIAAVNSMDHHELIKWISNTGGTHNKQDDAASSMEQEVIDAGNVGHEDEQINGSRSTCRAGDVGHHSEQIAESSDNGGASDRTRSSQETGQYDPDPSICGGCHDELTDHISDTVGAYDSREIADSFTENEVISAGNSLDHDELINWISNTGGTHNKQDDAASSMEQEVIDAGNVGHEVEQIKGSISSGGAGDIGHQQIAKSSENGGASDRTRTSQETGQYDSDSLICGRRHDEQTDPMNDTVGAYNSRENADSVMENEVITAGNSMDHHELINWISNTGGTHNKQDDAASSIEEEGIGAGNVGHVSEQINGSIITGGTGDVGHHSEQIAESSDNGGASERTLTSQETGQHDLDSLICGGRHDEQTDHMSDTVGACNSHESTHSLMDNEVISAGNIMDHHELINWTSNTGGTHNKQDDAASSMEQKVIDGSNVGHEGEQTNGSVSTGGAGDGGHHSAQMAETSDSGRASDKQQNASSSTGKEVVNAVDGGHHDDQIGDISITGGAYDKKEEMTLIPDQVVINAGNGGEPAEQVDGNTQLVGPSSGGTEPESMKLMKKLQLLFGDLTRVISGGGLKSSRNNKSKSELLSGQIVTLNPKMFTFSDLRRATNNFRPDVVLGKGGSGIVFKGWIDERTYTPSKVGVGMAIAVKKLDINGSLRPKEAQLKVKFLGKLSHPNLVKILGYCLEDDDFLLVYEHVQKRSLECHLFEKDAESIPWVKRMKIAIGAARGLNYLHKTKEQATYRSFKASDILLDGDFNAKLSDYGLTKLGQMNEESIISTLMPGDSAYIDFPQKDVGYIDPEYMTTGNLTVKSDVYGFGAVLLEILTGQRVLDMNWPDGNHDLVRYARPFLTGKKKLRSILDRRLEDNNPLKDETLSAIGALAINCLEDYPKNRPAMKEVLETLERINAIQMEPKETSSATEGHRTVHTEE